MVIPALLLMLTAGSVPVRSTPDLGVAEGRCRAGEAGPAVLITALGLKDRAGTLRAELYPPDQADFLADDNVLVAAGKTFRRVVMPVPRTGPVRICIRVPAAGSYALALTHDRDGRPKFDFWRDGIGFAGNPRLGLRAPPAASARVVAGAGVTQTSIILNYRHGVFGFRPLD
jgi:uncharacterized protein (DUF2141 family)